MRKEGKKKVESGPSFWVSRWQEEKESYVPCALSMYTGNLRALKKLLENFEIDLGGKTVLDVGCGKGFYSEFYRRKGALVHSTDISDWVVMKMEKMGFSSSLLDISGDLPVGVNSSFWVHCTQVLVHQVTEKDFLRSCRNLSWLTAVNGYLLVGDRFLPDRKIDKPHIKYREVVDYILTLSDQGMRLLDVLPSFPPGGRLLLFQKEI